MADETCIKAILEAAPHLSRAEAAAIDDAVALARKQAGARATLGDADAAAIDYARAQGDEAAMAAMIEKRNRALNIVVEQALLDFTLKDKQGARRLSALLVGSVRGFEGAARSIDAEGKALEAELFGALHSKLEAAGLRSILAKADEAFDRDLANELARLSDPNAGRDTGNAPARQAAEILHELQEAARTLQNEAGGWIGSLPGWIVRQSHDQHRIAKAGFEAWRDLIRPLLDDRTFTGRPDPEEFLRGVWVNLASGNHLKPDSLGSFKDPAFKGPGNLAKKISAERVLHFRDADAWFAYNREFGAASLLEAAAFGLRRAAQNTVLLRRLGTNPEAMFERIRDLAVMQAKKRNDLKEVKRLQSAGLQAEFDQVSGAANVPESPTLAAWGGGARAVLNMSSLGGVVLSSITDLPNAVGVLRRNGVPYLESWGASLQGFVAAAGSEARQASDLIGVGIDGAQGHMLDRFSSTDGVRGKLSKLQDRFFRLSLLSWWTDSVKRGMGFMLARHLADQAGKSLEALPKALQANFRRYGIGAAEWDAMRRAGVDAGDGARFLMPDTMARLDDAAVETLMGPEYAGAGERAKSAMLADKKRELQTMLQTYYVNEVNEAINQPGAAEQALLRLGTRPGTGFGEAVRFFMQFKSFPVTYVNRQLGRTMLGGLGTEGGVMQALKQRAVDAPGLVHLMLASTVFGYLAGAAKDLAKGREPRDPNDYTTWIAALKQGGGMGIYGDFLLGEYNRFGGGPVETLAGPGVGQAAQLLRVFGKIRDGEDPSASALQGVKNITPFLNLFYTRPALDYLFFYQLSESMNPGYLRRMESRLQRDNNQKFILSPADAIPKGGGDRILEGVR